jgi:hypothetical protein
MSRGFEGAHLREQDLRDLAQGKRSGAELFAQVFDHLAERCPECRAALAEYPRRHLVERVPGSYQDAIEGAVEAGAERAIDHLREHDEALPIVEELGPPRPLPQALALVASTHRFHRWGVATRLADAAEGLLQEDPEAARYWATLAVAIALAMEPLGCSEAVLETLRCATRMVLARALARSPERGEDADQELARAAEHFTRSTHNPRLEIELALARFEIPSSGRSWSHRLGLLRELEVRIELKESPDLGLRFLETLAVAFRESGHLEGALSGFRALLEAATEGSVPVPAPDRRRFELQLVETLLEIGRYDEAWAALVDDRGAIRLEGPPREHAARELLGAMAQIGLGRSPEAFPLFDSARQRLLEHGFGLAAAITLLHELALRLREEPKPEAEKLLDEVSTLYTAEGLPLWARAPLIRVQRLAWREKLTAEDVDEARSALAAGPPEDRSAPVN